MFLLLFFLIIFAYLIYWQIRRKSYPPGPTPIPIFGNVFQIDISNMHRQMLGYKKKYGGIFTIWLPEPFIIVNDYESLKEYFVKQGDIFAGRPNLNLSYDFVGGMYGLILNENSWYKSQRRYALHVLKDFGFGRPILQDTIIDQTNKMIQMIEKFNGESVDLMPYFTTAVGNVICQLVFGYVKKLEDPEIHMFQKCLIKVLAIFGSPVGSLVQTSMKFKILDPLFGGTYKKAKKANDWILAFCIQEVEKHKQNINYDEEPKDFIDAYLQEIRKREKVGNLEEYSENQLANCCYDIFSAGLETSATTARTFLLYMLHYPNVQAKIHEELDNVIGRENTITLSDQNRLPYFNACVQELYRIAPINPLTGLHIVLEDVQMGRYRIPKDTVVIPQFQSVHLDDEIYPDPHYFDPYRHLDSDGNLKKDEKIMPFGLGKRACLGESLARIEIFLFLTHLLQKFEFKPEIDGKPPKMDYYTGLIISPKPYKCRVIRRI